MYESISTSDKCKTRPKMAASYIEYIDLTGDKVKVIIEILDERILPTSGIDYVEHIDLTERAPTTTIIILDDEENVEMNQEPMDEEMDWEEASQEPEYIHEHYFDDIFGDD